MRGDTNPVDSPKSHSQAEECFRRLNVYCSGSGNTGNTAKTRLKHSANIEEIRATSVEAGSKHCGNSGKEERM